MLCGATRHFIGARFEVNSHKQAELILLGNGQTGLHEQIRLQPYIAGSLNAPLKDAMVDVAHSTFAKRLEKAVGKTARRIIAEFAHPLVEETERLWQEFCTKELMTLKVPGEVLRLGHDLRPPKGQALYPPALQTPDNPELVGLLGKYGALQPSSEGTATHDWALLSDRVRYIFELFRSRQQYAPLFRQPFTEEQRTAILNGQAPDGKLW